MNGGQGSESGGVPTKQIASGIMFAFLALFLPIGMRHGWCLDNTSFLTYCNWIEFPIPFTIYIRPNVWIRFHYSSDIPLLIPIMILLHTWLAWQGIKISKGEAVFSEVLRSLIVVTFFNFIAYFPFSSSSQENIPLPLMLVIGLALVGLGTNLLPSKVHPNPRKVTIGIAFIGVVLFLPICLKYGMLRMIGIHRFFCYTIEFAFPMVFNICPDLGSSSILFIPKLGFLLFFPGILLLVWKGTKICQGEATYREVMDSLVLVTVLNLVSSILSFFYSWDVYGSIPLPLFFPINYFLIKYGLPKMNKDQYVGKSLPQKPVMIEFIIIMLSLFLPVGLRCWQFAGHNGPNLNLQIEFAFPFNFWIDPFDEQWSVYFEFGSFLGFFLPFFMIGHLWLAYQSRALLHGKSHLTRYKRSLVFVLILSCIGFFPLFAPPITIFTEYHTDIFSIPLPLIFPIGLILIKMTDSQFALQSSNQQETHEH